MDGVYHFLPFETFKQLVEPCKYRGYILEPLQNSTKSAHGCFADMNFDEKTDIHKFASEARFPIVKIGSNFGEYTAENYIEPKQKEKKSNRGRKPAEPKKKKRIQGSGKYFNSQITFETMSLVQDNKRYYIKVFKNGVFQVPGVLSDNYEDVIGSLEAVRDSLSRVLARPIVIKFREDQMINKKTILKNKKLRILITRLGSLLANEQNGANPMNIRNVEYINAESSNKVIVQFSRPTKTNPHKKTTMKILRQKINIEGAVSQEDIVAIYRFINAFIISNYNDVISDPDAQTYSSSSSEDEQFDERKVATEEYDPYAF